MHDDFWAALADEWIEAAFPCISKAAAFEYL
jgi:hypothetical protein